MAEAAEPEQQHPGVSLLGCPASLHTQSQPEASSHFPAAGGRRGQQECRRMNGGFCADPSGERSKILQSLAWSSAQYLRVSLPSCSQNCPTTACFYTAAITRVFCARSSCSLIHTSGMVRHHHQNPSHPTQRVLTSQGHILSSAYCQKDFLTY